MSIGKKDWPKITSIVWVTKNVQIANTYFLLDDIVHVA